MGGGTLTSTAYMLHCKKKQLSYSCLLSAQPPQSSNHAWVHPLPSGSSTAWNLASLPSYKTMGVGERKLTLPTPSSVRQELASMWPRQYLEPTFIDKFALAPTPSYSFLSSSSQARMILAITMLMGTTPLARVHGPGLGLNSETDQAGYRSSGLFVFPQLWWGNWF